MPLCPANTRVDRIQILAVPIGANSAFQQMLLTRLAGFCRHQEANADGTFRLTNLVGDPRIDVSVLRSRLPDSTDGYLKEARFEATNVLSSPLRFSNASSGVIF